MAGLEKKAYKGLFAAEWAMTAYLVITTAIILIAYDRLPSSASMLVLRLRIVLITAAMVVLYRLLPCGVTRLARIIVQLVLLSWWYPDTFEFNRVLPNLDHLFAQADQTIFACQPALLFAQVLDYKFFSELMCLGYVCYYPLIAVVVLYFFFCRRKDFLRASFIIIASFFIYYIIFIALPVAGPQYYYPAVGLKNIAEGIFPAMGNYFSQIREALPTPGGNGGFFHSLVAGAHSAGERPTAAFPSSHVGITTILMLLVRKAKGTTLLKIMIPFYIILCLSTVYIYAHYVVDVFGGWLSAFILFYTLNAIHKLTFNS